MASPTVFSRSRRFSSVLLPPLVALGLLGSGCTSSDNGSGGGSADTTTTTAVPNPCTPQGDETMAKALVRCGDASIAYLSTEDVSGTGIVIERDSKRYVLTNAHVIDPYDSADVILAGETYDAMEVVGVDLVTDIALLGPFDDDVEVAPIPLAGDVEVARGDDAFTLGFPAELFDPDPEDLEPTIARGIMGRQRTDKEFDVTYLQSDVLITGGQSGGGLFDQEGRLVGVTSMVWGSEYAFAVSAPDIDRSIDSILAGDGDTWPALTRDPESDRLVTTETLSLAELGQSAALTIPPAAEKRTVTITTDHAEAVTLEVTDPNGDALALSSNMATGVEQLMARMADGSGSGQFDGLLGEEGVDAVTGTDLIEAFYGELDDSVTEAETEPGTLTFEVPADTRVHVDVDRLESDEAVEATLTSTVGFEVVRVGFATSTLEPGDSDEVVLAPSLPLHIIEVAVEAGQEITVDATAPAEDIALAVIPPDVDLISAVLFGSGEGVENVDKKESGPFENAEQLTFTAESAGTYRIVVGGYLGLTSLVRIALSAA